MEKDPHKMRANAVRDTIICFIASHSFVKEEWLFSDSKIPLRHKSLCNALNTTLLNAAKAEIIIRKQEF